jgi:2-polyprenyl-3-methyl-5-hydroxy-6-metoxy-1,4-benzoquinol methylase
VAPKVIDILKGMNARTVLDMGCGTGDLCGLLDQQGFYTAGVEPDLERVSAAMAANPHLKFYNLGVHDNPLDILDDHPDKFDAVVSTEVIEHLYAPRQLPQFAARVLKPTGYLILSTPYHGYLKNLAISLFNKWDHHHTVLWEGGHIKFWSKITLSRLLRENGFNVLHVAGAGRFAFFWKSMIVTAAIRP